MNDNIGWFFAKVKCKMGGGKEALNKYLRKKGIKVGDGTKTASNIHTAEPYLVEIGRNVTISHSVDFVTHDNSVCKIFGVDHDLYGKIIIGDNCFIGAHATIMYGVTLADNVIVAAGSVVTKSIKESNVIIGGNPAKIIGTWDKFKEKSIDTVIHAGHLSYTDKRMLIESHQEKLIKR